MVDKFTEVINSLYKFNGLVSNSDFEKLLVHGAINSTAITDLIKKLRNDKNFSLNSDNEFNKLLQTLISAMQSGGLTSDEFSIELLSLYAIDPIDEKIYDIFSFTKDASGGDSNKEAFHRMYHIKNELGLEANSPTISTFEWHHPNLNYANRQTLGPEIMLTNVPNVEISRAVPYFDCKLVVKDNLPLEASDGNGFTGRDLLIKEKSVSLYKFLENGNVENNEQIYSFISAQPVNVDDYKDINKLGQDLPNSKTDLISVSGMELFTSPQVLANHETGFKDLDYTLESYKNGNSISSSDDNVVDKFRPFMTFSSFNLNVTPATGMLATKSADLKIILHDRSRLNQIMPFITPGGVGNVEFLIEYGWSHPDNDPSQNPYGAIINSMRVKEKFGVMNSSYSFTEEGQVDITLKLYTKGADNATFDLITALSDDQKHPVEFLKDLVKAVRDAKSAISKEGVKLNAEMGAPDILGKISSVKGLLSLTKEQRKEITAFIKSIKNAGNDEDLKQKFSAFGEAWEGAEQEATDFVQKLQGHYEEAINNIINSDNDPWLNVNNYLGIDNKKFVSLNKILLELVAKPLHQTGNFDDIQLHFYPMNEYAMWARELTVGQYPIEKNRFKDYMMEKLKTTPSLTIQKLLNFIKKEFVSNKADVVYGLSNYYKRTDEGKWELKEEWTSSDKKRQEFALTKNEIMKACYKTGQKTFKMPKIHMNVETVPVKEQDGKTILKLHFFDAAASSYGGFAQLWDASLNTDLGIFGAYTKYKKSDPTPPKQSHVARDFYNIIDHKFDLNVYTSQRISKANQGRLFNTSEITSLGHRFAQKKDGISSEAKQFFDGIQKGYTPKPELGIKENNAAWQQGQWENIFSEFKIALEVVKGFKEGTKTIEISKKEYEAVRKGGNFDTPIGPTDKTFKSRKNCMVFYIKALEYIQAIYEVLGYYGGSMSSVRNIAEVFPLNTGNLGLTSEINSINAEKDIWPYVSTQINAKFAWMKNGGNDTVFATLSGNGKKLFTTKSYNEDIVHGNFYKQVFFMNGPWPIEKYPPATVMAPLISSYAKEYNVRRYAEFQNLTRASGKFGISDMSTAPAPLEAFFSFHQYVWDQKLFGEVEMRPDAKNIRNWIINVAEGYNINYNENKTSKRAYSKTRQQKEYEMMLLERENKYTLYEDNMLKSLQYFVENGIIEPILVKQKIEQGNVASVEVPKFRIKCGGLALRTVMSEHIPTLRYGTTNSGIIGAQLSTMSNPAMETIHMQRQQRKEKREIAPFDDGVPLLVKPVELSMDTFGCPFLAFGQQYFVDFNTNTSIDDVYIVTGLSHSLSPGNFQSTIKLMPMNKLGKFRSMIDNVDDAIGLVASVGKATLEWDDVESILQNIKNFKEPDEFV